MRVVYAECMNIEEFIRESMVFTFHNTYSQSKMILASYANSLVCVCEREKDSANLHA